MSGESRALSLRSMPYPFVFGDGQAEVFGDLLRVSLVARRLCQHFLVGGGRLAVFRETQMVSVATPRATVHTHWRRYGSCLETLPFRPRPKQRWEERKSVIKEPRMYTRYPNPIPPLRYSTQRLPYALKVTARRRRYTNTGTQYFYFSFYYSPCSESPPLAAMRIACARTAGIDFARRVPRDCVHRVQRAASRRSRESAGEMCRAREHADSERRAGVRSA
ncbi:hypothetical protein DFH06DRAFT_1146165 [Mycena polygramma]|nr:hypothetical protein DFH06DRAFT_1146165 [Mycena polygramma]